MRIESRNNVSFVAIVLSLLAGASSAFAGDQTPDRSGCVVAPETSRGVPVLAVRSQAEPQAAAAAASPRDGVRGATARADDPITESFDRMLAHTPSTHRPPVPAGFGVDPLISAMIEPQRRWQAEHAVARHAAACSPRAER
ncbi:MAG: hypothetical protein IT520_07715 [Burkholderiales bacterium]|nr:hypothetical protein [Burkholderiales bacterium]